MAVPSWIVYVQRTVYNADLSKTPNRHQEVRKRNYSIVGLKRQIAGV